MNSRTKNTLVIVSIVFLITVGIGGFILTEIKAKGALLSEYIAVLDERSAQRDSFIRVKRQVDETADNRELIRKSFFKDESDSIDFLGEVESFAQSINLELETEELNKTQSEDKKTEYIDMTFVYQGQKDQVLNFTKLLENIPYHSWIKTLELREELNGDWTGRLELSITIQPL